ncbi:MAG: M48 family metallopeptidase, partial [Melioribacteraceae bacterium]|nr:M48 family metallopeptidase [Melioribacteraceae bacterium]
MESKKYNNLKLSFGIFKTILTFVIIFLFVKLDYSKVLVEYIMQITDNNYFALVVFVAVAGTFSSIIFFPINLYSGFIMEHKFKLSNQTFFGWIWENFKATLIGIVIGIPLLLLFYYVLNVFGNLWWLPFSIILFVLTVVLSKIVPIVILPLFYKVTPIDNEELRQRIIELSKSVNLNVENVFKFDMSKNTKKANAAFTGLGKTKKILLGDTLLNEFTTDEIETVIAHELGHYKHKHIIINIFVSTISSFITLYLISILYSTSLEWFGFKSIFDIAALPLLSLWGMLIGLVQT